MVNMYPSHVSVRFLEVFLCLVLVLSLGYVMQAKADSPQEKFKVCAVCHGNLGEGNETIGAPRIGGQYEWYIKRQLTHFRNDIRGSIEEEHYGHIMANVAKLLKSEDDIEILAKYASSLKGAEQGKCTLGGNVENGKKLYGMCAACHKRNAEGSRAMNTPILNFQPDWYIYRELKNFKREHRGVNPKDFAGKQMVAVANSLKSDQDMIDLATYICSLD